MPRLESLIGKDITVFLTHPIMNQKEPVMTTRLVDVEISGIWIEGRDLANYFHEKYGQSIVPKMPIFFVPFAQFGWIFSSADYPSLSEKGLGV